MLRLRRKQPRPVVRPAPPHPRRASWLTLERALQISVATLSALGSVMLAMAEDNNALLGVVAIFVAAASVYLTDVKGWVRLSRTAGDVAAVAALLFALFRYRQDLSEANLLALVNFVVYVQFVLQLWEKRTSIYWLLILLSLMQVAVATALDVRLMFGVLLAVYMSVAVFTLVLFYLYRENRRAQADAAASLVRQAAIGRPLARWPLDAQATRFAGHPTAQQTDDLVDRRLVWLALRCCGGAALVTALVFSVFPRSGQMHWQSNNAEQARREVGFSSEVTLGEQGSVTESSEEVMQVWLTNRRTGRVYELDDLPLFRGVALTDYENKRWSASRAGGNASFLEMNPSEESRPLVLQRFRAQPVKDQVMFAIFPSYKTDLTDEFPDIQGKQTEYERLTAGVTNRRMAKIVPAPRAPRESELERLSALPMAPEGGRDPLLETKALAAEIVQDIPAEDHFGRARALTNYLRDSTRFTYSLQPVPRDPTLDPVEDFVNRTRAGHCEYFASALALMLRSIDIPARLAVGFKGGEWDNDHYNVTQMDAHAWVEAYLPTERIPPGNLSPDDSKNGAWMILDPTTSNDAQTISTAEFLLQGMKRGLSAIRAGWNNYVLGMDYDRQQSSLFRPVANAAMAFITGVSHRETWVAFFAKLREMLSPTYWGLANGGWFSWRGAVAAIVIMLVTLGAYRIGRYALDKWGVWRKSDGGGAVSGGMDVEFYRRFEALLAQHHLQRAASQTPREFALTVGGQLAESPRTAPAAALPRQIAELFYRVRFGRRPLDTPEAETVERALTELAGALALGNPRRPQDA